MNHSCGLIIIPCDSITHKCQHSPPNNDPIVAGWCVLVQKLVFLGVQNHDSSSESWFLRSNIFLKSFTRRISGKDPSKEMYVTHLHLAAQRHNRGHTCTYLKACFFFLTTIWNPSALFINIETMTKIVQFRWENSPEKNYSKGNKWITKNKIETQLKVLELEKYK